VLSSCALRGYAQRSTSAYASGYKIGLRRGARCGHREPGANVNAHTHADLSRRFFLRCAAAVAGGALAESASAAEPLPKELDAAVAKLEVYFTPQDKFQDVSRGRPVPHSLPLDKRKEVGLTPETWKLEILSDPEHPAKLGKQLTAKDGTAFDFAALMKLAEKHAVRFAKIMTCLNLNCPLGTGVWEGVPLRELLWLTQPKGDVRRVFFYGYHNDDPKQMFRSSLPVGRVLEDYDGLPPVIACYKLNGELLTQKRGGPVRVLVPEHYGFKSVKWLTHLYLSNGPAANDTYATQNNDVDSPMKTFCEHKYSPNKVKAGAPIPLAGYAQSGIGGLSKVQVWATPAEKEWPKDDPYFTKAPWTDATILPPPKDWGVKPELLKGAFGFDAAGAPKVWPMRLAKAYWAALLPGLAAGAYVVRCRTIDTSGHAQPMPRPFRKGGCCEIESWELTVEA
jgi:DMSO/TMAO reductase YedYZ molybdopterin-dependent catalytic subunit